MRLSQREKCPVRTHFLRFFREMIVSDGVWSPAIPGENQRVSVNGSEYAYAKIQSANFPPFQYVALRRISMYSRLFIGSYFFGLPGPKHPGTQSTVSSWSAPMKYGIEYRALVTRPSPP